MEETQATRTVSRGTCVFCQKIFAKSGMRRHLQACTARQQAIVAERGRKAKLFHLFVGGTYAKEFWMHLEMPASATLSDLDQFLRDIWLECCGHLSAFTIGHTRYEMDTGGIDGMWSMFFGPSSPPQSMEAPLSSVLRPGMAFSHEYDFGSTTDLSLQVVAEREGVMPKKETVQILARNELPDFRCEVCDKPAKYINVFEDYTLLCDECVVEEGYDEGLLPVVNSPRMGVCGYTGEAW
jgi:hypothetical protein